MHAFLYKATFDIVGFFFNLLSRDVFCQICGAHYQLICLKIRKRSPGLNLQMILIASIILLKQ